MSAQTTYSVYTSAAQPGLIADGFNPRRVVSKAVETAAGIGFGLVVDRGTDAEKEIVLGGAEETFIGISVRDLTKEGAINTGAVAYSQYDSASVIESGGVYVQCKKTGTAGALLAFNPTTGEIAPGAVDGTYTEVLTGWTLEQTVAAIDDIAVIAKK